MKFEFCGKNECPEWVLSESALISKLTAVKLKQILHQIIRKILNDPSFDENKIFVLCNDCHLSQEESFWVIAILDFIISSATKSSVNQDIFSKEISHLGIPIENVNVIVKAYTENAKDLEIIRLESLRISQIKEVEIKTSNIIASSLVGDVEYEPNEERAPIGIQINMAMDIEEFPHDHSFRKVKSHKFAMSFDKLAALTEELKEALFMMTEE